jgi:hypothetical protein
MRSRAWGSKEISGTLRTFVGLTPEEHNAVLPGRHRVPPQRRGLQNQGGEILGLEASFYLDELLSQG